MRTKGWQQIFRFTFVQHIKTKSFIIGTIIMCVFVAAVAVLSNILPAVLSDRDNDPSGGSAVVSPEFDRIVIYDDGQILEDEDYSLIESLAGKTELPSVSADDTEKELLNTEKALAVTHITAQTDDEGTVIGYSVQTKYSAAAGSDAADYLNSILTQTIERRNLINLGVPSEDYEKTQISIYSTRVEAGKDELSFVKSAMNYFVPIVVSLVLFIFIYTYGTLVAQSIANEKTGRVMELLLTSVRPLAVVVGKVLAMGLVSFGQFAFLGIVGAAAFAISAPFGWMKTAMSGTGAASFGELSSLVSAGALAEGQSELGEFVNELSSAFSVGNILLIILVFVLGFLFFALLAALVGASVSRTEDLQQAMQPYALTGVLGMYLAYSPVIFNAGSLDTGEAVTNPVQIFSYYFPISSPFALPSAIMLGTLSPLEITFAVVILAVAVILAAVIVSKVYEAIILHNGSRLKISDIIKLAVRK